jgi:hypothetical protein
MITAGKTVMLIANGFEAGLHTFFFKSRSCVADTCFFMFPTNANCIIYSDMDGVASTLLNNRFRKYYEQHFHADTTNSD